MIIRRKTTKKNKKLGLLYVEYLLSVELVAQLLTLSDKVI